MKKINTILQNEKVLGSLVICSILLVVTVIMIVTRNM